MDFNCNTIDSFFAQLPVSESTKKLKAELYEEFIEKYEEFLNEGFDEIESLRKASDSFENLAERFPNLIEEGDYVIEINRGVDIINSCQAVCYLIWLLLVASSFIIPIIDSKFEIEAGSFGDGLILGIIGLLCLVMFVACRIPDRKISKKIAKAIIKQKQNGLQLGTIGLTYFLFPYVFSTTVVLFGVIFIVIEFL